MRNNCTIDECTSRVHGHGMCTKHYLRWYAHGDPRYERKTSEACGIQGCANPPRSRTAEHCEMHYYRIRRNGDALNLKNTRKPDPLYRAAHSRIQRERGKARAYDCVDCGQQAWHWSYNHGDPNEKTSPSGQPYSLNTANYSPRCYRCHMILDGVGANQYTRR